MLRRMVILGLLCGALCCAQPASAQGLWLGYPGFFPYGFGYPSLSGGFAPVGFGYPVVVRPVYVARPVIYGGVVSSGLAPVYRPRPAVRVPLNRAYRRIWRRGW